MNRARLIRHITFWIIWFLTMSVFYGMNPKGNMFLKSFSSLGFSLPIYLAYSYLTVYGVIPVTLFNKHFMKFLIYLVFASLLGSVLLRINSGLLFYRIFDADSSGDFKILDWFPVATNMVWINVPLFMFVSVKYIYNYSVDLSRKKELEKENLQAELSLLSIQLRPHFLFNTLNNLYSMALSDDPKSSWGLSRIINMLHYILFECSEEHVELYKEINLIDNYIELERLRYDERLDFRFSRDVRNSNTKITPMLLFTFIENSFKHGSSPDAGKSFIHLYLKEEESKIIFTSENSYPDEPESIDTKGLGLENVKKRLELLYPQKHRLKLTKKNSIFKVELELMTYDDQVD